MTPSDIKKLREDLGRSQAQMAKALKVSGRTWGRWENGDCSPIPIAEEQLEKLWRMTYGKDY